VNLRHLAAFLKRFPRMRSITLAQMSQNPRIWKDVLSMAKEC
jgi:hypothetical protein